MSLTRTFGLTIDIISSADAALSVRVLVVDDNVDSVEILGPFSHALVTTSGLLTTRAKPSELPLSSSRALRFSTSACPSLTAMP